MAPTTPTPTTLTPTTPTPTTLAPTTPTPTTLTPTTPTPTTLAPTTPTPTTLTPTTLAPTTLAPTTLAPTTLAPTTATPTTMAPTTLAPTTPTPTTATPTTLAPTTLAPTTLAPTTTTPTTLAPTTPTPTTVIPTTAIPECDEGQLLLEMVRTCGNNGEEESFQIFEGQLSASSEAIFAQSSCAVGTSYLCINPVLHTLLMRDTAANGWSPGSFITLKCGGISNSYRAESGFVIYPQYFNFAPTVAPTTASPTTITPTSSGTGTIYVSQQEYPTIDDIPRNAETLIFTSGAYANLTELTLSGFSNLESIVFKSNSFSNTHSLYIESATVSSITFENFSFNGISDNGVLSLHTPNLQFVVFEPDVMKNIRTIYLRGFSKSILWTVYNRSLVSLETIYYANMLSGFATSLVQAIESSGTSTDNITIQQYIPTYGTRILNAVESASVDSPVECGKEQLLIKMVSTCDTGDDERMLEIYEGGLSFANIPIFRQSLCLVGTSFICINPVEHTLVMEDHSVHGASPASSISLNHGEHSLDFVLKEGMNRLITIFSFGPTLSAIDSKTTDEDQIQVTLIRSCGNSSDSEGFTIYEGSTRDHAIYSQPACVAGLVNLYITRGLYTIVMTNSNGLAWAENSMVRIFYTSLLGSYRKVVVGAEESAVFALPEMLVAGTAWKYSSEAQVGTSWTTANVEWSLTSEYPVISTVTRYFRQSYTLSGAGFRSVIIQVKMSGGFVFYVNGVEASRFNLPAGEITASTMATEPKESNVYRILRLSLDAYSAVNGVYEFAVEVHAAEGQMGEAEHFECSIEFTIYEQSLVGSGQATSNMPGITTYTIQNLFDNTLSTKYRVAVTSSEFPVEVTYTFPEGDAYTMNKYVMTNGDSVAAACNTWKIFGRMNNDSDWVMLDSQDNVKWSETNQSLGFTVNNVNAYNAYMFQCSSVVNIDDEYNGNLLEMAEWILGIV